MNSGGSRGQINSEINVTPLIDIMLVLLIVFIAMVPALNKAAKVVVPQVNTQVNPPKSKEVPIVVSVTSEGRFFLQTKEIQLADMTEQLYDVIRLQPFNLRRVILKVDEDARFQYAVDALDRIRLAGDRVKQETRENPKFEGLDGGDVKVPISYLRK